MSYLGVGEGNNGDKVTVDGRGFIDLVIDADSTIMDGKGELDSVKEGDSTIREGITAGTALDAFFGTL